MPIQITDEMREAAGREAKRRNPKIKHHFELEYMSGAQRDIVGFLGEFACKECLGLDWRAGIRENYDTIDRGDILQTDIVVDIKTETIPNEILMKLIRGQVGDDQPYGRRLINQEQIPLLEHYDYVVWGAFSRGMNNGLWFSLGYLETAFILEHYRPTIRTPFGTRYNEPCMNIRQSQLKSMYGLSRILSARRGPETPASGGG